MGKTLLAVVFVFLVASDILHGELDLASPRGWFELVFPYMPLLALLAGALPGAAAWLVVFAVVLSLGAPPLLVSATIFPMIVTVGLVTFALPIVPARVFSVMVLVLVPLVWLVNPDMTSGVLVLGLLAVCAASAGLGANTFRARSERDAQKVVRLTEEQARIRNFERTRLAHELHDIVAHDVTIIAMQARRAEFVADPAKTAKILESIGEAAFQALQDLRSLVVLLKTEDQIEIAGSVADANERPAEGGLLDAPDPSGETTTAVALIHDIRNVADAVERAGFRVQLDIEGSVAMVPASLRQALRRTVRELGTNILKHGDSDADVRLRLAVDEEHVALSSANRVSSGIAVSSSQTGIEAMRARCEVFGGRVFTDSTSGIWSTTMTIPLERRTALEKTQGALT
ncbi:hypothetical protein GCM10027403_17400 [Arthrobacter tecti]